MNKNILNRSSNVCKTAYNSFLQHPLVTFYQYTQVDFVVKTKELSAELKNEITRLDDDGVRHRDISKCLNTLFNVLQ